MITEEEKEAINNAENILKEWQKIVDIKDPIERDIEMSMYSEEMPFNTIKTLLTLITKLQEENEKTKWLYERALSDVEEGFLEVKKRDKVIEEMAKFIHGFDIDESICKKNRRKKMR